MYSTLKNRTKQNSGKLKVCRILLIRFISEYDGLQSNSSRLLEYGKPTSECFMTVFVYLCPTMLLQKKLYHVTLYLPSSNGRLANPMEAKS